MNRARDNSLASSLVVNPFLSSNYPHLAIWDALPQTPPTLVATFHPATPLAALNFAPSPALQFHRPPDCLQRQASRICPRWPLRKLARSIDAGADSSPRSYRSPDAYCKRYGEPTVKHLSSKWGRKSHIKSLGIRYRGRGKKKKKGNGTLPHRQTGISCIRMGNLQRPAPKRSKRDWVSQGGLPRSKERGRTRM